MKDAPVNRKQLAFSCCSPRYRDLHFTLLEINPLVVDDTTVTPLDLAAKIDETAHFLCHVGNGRRIYRSVLSSRKGLLLVGCEDGGILETDNLECHWSVWTPEGGGASVVYADTIWTWVLRMS